MNECRIEVNEPEQFIVIVAVEHAVFCLEKAIYGHDGPLRCIEGRHVVVPHKESNIFIAFVLVDIAVPNFERVEFAALVKDTIKGLIV